MLQEQRRESDGSILHHHLTKNLWAQLLSWNLLCWKLQSGRITAAKLMKADHWICLVIKNHSLPPPPQKKHVDLGFKKHSNLERDCLRGTGHSIYVNLLGQEDGSSHWVNHKVALICNNTAHTNLYNWFLTSKNRRIVLSLIFFSFQYQSLSLQTWITPLFRWLELIFPFSFALFHANLG